MCSSLPFICTNGSWTLLTVLLPWRHKLRECCEERESCVKGVAFLPPILPSMGGCIGSHRDHSPPSGESSDITGTYVMCRWCLYFGFVSAFQRTFEHLFHHCCWQNTALSESSFVFRECIFSRRFMSSLLWREVGIICWLGSFKFLSWSKSWS